MDALDFVFANETATKTLSAGLGGYIAGIVINHHAGTPTLTVKIQAKCATQDDIIESICYSKSSPADGILQPFQRMQTTAGAPNSGAGEFTKFVVPPSATIEAETDGAWTGDVRVVIEKA